MGQPIFVGDNEAIVAEAFAWGASTAQERVRLTGSGTLEIPDRRNIISVRSGVFCDGYVFGSDIDVDVFVLGKQDIFLSDWEPLHGNWGFTSFP